MAPVPGGEPVAYAVGLELGAGATGGANSPVNRYDPVEANNTLELEEWPTMGGMVREWIAGWRSGGFVYDERRGVVHA